MIIPFYFDYACPWAYLGSCRVEAYFQDLGATIDFRPVQLRTLAEPGAGQKPALGERKKANYRNDMRHWAEMIGAEVSPDAAKLRKSSTKLALKVALVAKDLGRFREFHYPAYRARWADARDLSDESLLRELIGAAGLDVDTVMHRAESQDLTDRLERETQDAIRRGVFGVPTLFVGDEMFWGNDRFELVRYYLQKA